MHRSVLLVEPGYKSKFPPLGLMKISAYHKHIGDRVNFVKGFSNTLAVDKSQNTLVSERFWDRVYVTTLFTYNWQLTIDTINHYKKLVGGDSSRIFVGGIMASLEPKVVWEETGIVPFEGVLNRPGLLDNNELVVDSFVPDYTLFDNTPYDYPLVKDAYIGYSTRGCIRKCEFCGVHKLEPKFIEYEGLIPYVNQIVENYGPKKDLILFDNNILASKKFKQIIKDIKELGFESGAKFGPTKKARKVDFNQGTDARILDDSKARLLSEICVHPLRIAFDSIKYRDLYEEKIRLVAKYGIRHLSNYILYNHHDSPADFWERLRINIDLNEELDLQIYSFPMKYIPLNAKDRSFIDSEHWNWLFLRNVQRILNVLKGSVMTSREFFHRAFGENESQFLEILHMPERIIMYRGREVGPEEQEWLSKFRNLTNGEKAELVNIVCSNRSRKEICTVVAKQQNRKLKEILEYYLPEGISDSSDLPLFAGLKR